eukprot:3466289-Rhodomonas_salina.1
MAQQDLHTRIIAKSNRVHQTLALVDLVLGPTWVVLAVGEVMYLVAPYATSVPHWPYRRCRPISAA